MAQRAADRRQVAVGLWVCLRRLGLPIDKAYPKEHWQRLVLTFAEVGTVRSVDQYLRLMELMGLLDRKGKTVVLRDPGGPIPYYRPPEALDDPDVPNTPTPKRSPEMIA